MKQASNRVDLSNFNLLNKLTRLKFKASLSTWLLWKEILHSYQSG